MKQRTDETLIEFSSRVKSVAYEGFPEMSPKQRSELEVHAFLQGCQEKTFAERVILNTHPDLDSALNDMVKMVQNAHIFKPSNLEKTRVVRNLNNPEATEDTDRTQVARYVWENKNSKVQENSSMDSMSLVLREIMKNLDQKDDPIMFDHLWGDAEKIDEPPIMFDHLWGDAEKIEEPPIMFDHLWGDAEKIYKPLIRFDLLWGDAEKIDEPPIMFDHLWGDAEKIYKPLIRFDHLWGDAEKIDEPPIMFDHLWGDVEKIDKPPIMFDHLWGDAEKIPITLTYDKNQGVQLALSAKQVYIEPVDDMLPSTVLDPLKIINADIRAVNVEDAKESTLHTPVPNRCSTLLVSDIRDKQREDPDFILAVNWVFNETVPTQAELAMSSTVARFYWSNRNLLSEKNEIIYYRWIEDTSSRDLIIVPRALKEVVLSGCHDEITAGHFSSRKTLSRIRQNYFWRNMSQDCSLYVHSCVNCST